MRVLVIKTSSLGDVIHTLPALTDAMQAIPGISFDWVVEEAFTDIPGWHPAVNTVIPVAIRRWRQHPVETLSSGQWQAFCRMLRQENYDCVIDAQGLFKSAFLTRYVSAPSHGFDLRSIREPLACLFYRHRHFIPKRQHAIARIRTLFSQALGYPLPDLDAPPGPHAYGLDRKKIAESGIKAPETVAPYLVFLHGTTWPTKHWPEYYWRRLIERAVQENWHIHLLWGHTAEYNRAHRLADGLENVTVLPKLSLTDIAIELANATACVATDTGLGHLAAALDVPALSLFGPTNPKLTGAWGRNQYHLASDFPCAPCLQKKCTYIPREAEENRFDLVHEQPLCFTRLPPERVWLTLASILEETALSLEQN